MRIPSIDILYVIGSKPQHGGSIGNRRFRELHFRLSKHFSIGIVEPSYRSSFEISEIQGITVFYIPLVAKFLLNSENLHNYALFRGTFYMVSPYYLRRLSRSASLVHESMSPFPFYSKTYTRKRTLLTIHEIRSRINFLIFGSVGFAPFIFEKSLKKFKVFYDRIISVSKSTQLKLKDMGIRSHLVFNGVDTTKFCPSRGFYENDTIRIMTVGRFTKQKGYQLLPFIARSLLMKHKNLKFIIIGYGPLKRDTLLLLQKLGIIKFFEFYSNLKEKEYIKLLQNSDIYIHLNPYQEGFGLSVAEVMSCGKPVVAFNIPGINEIVSNGVSGFLVKPLNIIDFIEKLESVITDKKLRKWMGMNARNIIVSKFTWDNSAKRLKQLYEELLDNS